MAKKHIKEIVCAMDEIVPSLYHKTLFNGGFFKSIA